MKVEIYRNGTWYSGLCLDEVSIKCDKEMNIEHMYQQERALKEIGYEIKDQGNNPFSRADQFEYYNKYQDKVVVRVWWKDKTIIYILKQYEKIENCQTTVEVITRLGALNELHNDVVNIFQKEYGLIEVEGE
jgi:hypothetical protein